MTREPLTLHVLGPLELVRGDRPVPLPRSRKTRALLGYLALARRPLRRERLCELLWDGPDDPRAALRWSLSKLRGLLDDEQHQRLHADRQSVRLDVAHLDVDGLFVAAKAGLLGELDDDELVRVLGRLRGELLEGLEVPHCPTYEAWLIAQRHAFRDLHVAVIDALAERWSAEPERVLPLARRRVELNPRDDASHLALLECLARAGRRAEAEQQFEVFRETFAREGLPAERLVQAWHRISSSATRAGSSRATEAPAVHVPVDVLDREIARAGDGADDEPPLVLPGRPSVAVLPFLPLPYREEPGGLADGLASEIIARLSRLRSLFVIARGSSFRYRGEAVDPRVVGRELGVRYVVTGSVAESGGRLRISAELLEADSRRGLWSERFERTPEDLFEVQDEITDAVVGMVESEVEMAERQRALLVSSTHLDAWGAYHRGAWHGFRFTRDHNEEAQRFFQLATELDPTFSRAHAGRSFTHFQTAFVHPSGDKATEARERALSLEHAKRSVSLDDRDAMAHCSFGRALWLNGMEAEAGEELERAVDLSPNYAFGHYSIGFINVGDDLERSLAAMEMASRLSPFDPLRFGMDCGRAMVLMAMGDVDECALWSVRAARRPNAHVHIQAMAAFALGLAGRREAALAFSREVARLSPGYTCDDFFAAFRTLSDDVQGRVRAIGPVVGVAAR